MVHMRMLTCNNFYIANIYTYISGTTGRIVENLVCGSPHFLSVRSLIADNGALLVNNASRCCVMCRQM